MKNVRDIQGLALAIVLERLKTHGAFPEVHENTRTQEQSQLDKHRKQVQILANQIVMDQGMEAHIKRV
ncbi:hypothetical protein HanRHA438_Chr16g0753981 [Helianthus annuus]|nr:hypothetical protein HanIR_Chr16g0806681 [Helianthus annuus]KAJ0644408.1 hypothetical protein HanOQP8_Chr16g0611761 [Helianthus annuus]KAJ0835328.1 hypothetical protein HanRHA438_Chr16g0753981 [Helianthus annuus]